MMSKELLIKAANDYYNGRSTGMDDFSYDQLKASVEKDDPTFNLWDFIIIDEDDRVSMPHPIPYTPQEFKTPFETMEEFWNLYSPHESDHVLTYKMDGTSVSAYYKNGKLYNILTRSDEWQGKKKLDQLKSKVKLEVDPRVLKIDYEAICCREDFPEDTRSNSNGLINSCYKQDEVDKYITLIPFKVTTISPTNYFESFDLAGYTEFDIPLVNKKITFDDRYVLYKDKHYPIDGFVAYNLNDNTKPHKIYKHYGNQSVATVVSEISWTQSNYLAWVPKIELETILIDGRNVSRCASGGIDNLRWLKAGVGAEVEIILSNSTIPQISRVIKPSEDYQFMKTCPTCGSPMEEFQNKLRCSNLMCPQVVNAFIYEFIGSTFGYDFINSINTDEVKSIVDIESFKTFIINNNLTLKFRNVVNFSCSIFIERFSKISEFAEEIYGKLDLIKSERKIDNLDYYMFTWNQYETLKRFFPIMNEIIDKVLL